MVASILVLTILTRYCVDYLYLFPLFHIAPLIQTGIMLIFLENVCISEGIAILQKTYFVCKKYRKYREKIIHHEGECLCVHLNFVQCTRLFNC